MCRYGDAATSFLSVQRYSSVVLRTKNNCKKKKSSSVAKMSEFDVFDKKRYFAPGDLNPHLVELKSRGIKFVLAS